MSVDNVRLKQESMNTDGQQILEDINPVSNTNSINDSASGEKLAETLNRIWNTINNKLTRVVNSVNGRTGPVILTSDDVGLGNVDNVSYADIKAWTIQTIQEMFGNMRLHFYQSPDDSDFTNVIENNDTAMVNVPFYCDRGLGNDARAQIGYFFFNNTTGHMDYVIRPIPTIGNTDSGLYYVTSVADYNPDSAPIGTIGVNIFKEDEYGDIYLVRNDDKAESGLKIDGSKIVGRLYYADGVYGTGDVTDASAFLWFAEDTAHPTSPTIKGEQIHILFDGVELDQNGLGYYLRNNTAYPFKIGDLLLCNFRSYPGSNASTVLHEGMDNRLMWRSPALGIITSAPSFETPDAEYIIDFKSLNQFPGWGIQYIVNHRNTSRDIKDQVIGLKLSAGSSQNYSGLQVLSDAAIDSNPYDPSEVFGYGQIAEMKTATGQSGSGYTVGQLMRLIVSTDDILSNTIIYVKEVTTSGDTTGSITEIGVVTDPNVYDAFGISKEGLGFKQTLSGTTYTYGPYEHYALIAPFDAVLIGSATIVEHDDQPDTFADIQTTPPTRPTEAEDAQFAIKYPPGIRRSIGTFGAYVRPDMISSEGLVGTGSGTTDDYTSGLMVTTDASLCVNPNVIFGRWYDPEKSSTYYVDSKGNKHGLSSKLVKNYTTSRTIPQLEDDPIRMGILNDPSPISVNLRKEVQLFSFKPDTSHWTLAYRNLSGIRVVPFETDPQFESTRDKYMGNQTDGLNAHYQYTPLPGTWAGGSFVNSPINEWSSIRARIREFDNTFGTPYGDEYPNAEVLSGGLQINTGKYLEIDPSFTPNDADSYYDSGKLQVRTGRGFNEDYTYIMVGRKDRNTMINTDEFPVVPGVLGDGYCDLDMERIPDDDFFLDPYYYEDHKALGDPAYFVHIDPIAQYDSLATKPNDFVEGAVFYKKSTVSEFISLNPYGWTADKLQALSNAKPGTTAVYYKYTITQADVESTDPWNTTLWHRKNIQIRDLRPYLVYGDIYWRVHSNRLGFKTDDTLQLDRPAVLKIDFTLLEHQPSDWDENYWKYFTRSETSTGYSYHCVDILNDDDEEVAPEWQADTYYEFSKDLSAENDLSTITLGVRSPVRPYESGKIYKKNQLLEYDGKIYITTKDFVKTNKALPSWTREFDRLCGGNVTDNNDYTATVYKSQTVALDMAAGYLSNRFAQDVVVEYEVGAQYPAGQFVQHEGKLYLVIKTYEDYYAKSIYEDIDAGYLSNAFNTSIRKVLYFRDINGRSFTFDPSGTKETRQAEAGMTIAEQKRFKEYEYVKLGAGLKVTGGDVPIEIKCSKTDLRNYLLEEVERLSVAEEIMYARTLYPDWGASSQSENNEESVIFGYYDTDTRKFYADAEKTSEISGAIGKIYKDIPTEIRYTWDGTTWNAIDGNSTLLDADVTLQQILDFDDQFTEDISQIRDYTDQELIRNTALNEDRTVGELRMFKQTLDTIRINLEDPEVFFLGRKEYLLDDYRTLQIRTRKLVYSANAKVNKTDLYKALIDYFELGSTVEPTFSSIQTVTQDFMLMNIAKLEWLFNDWAQMVYNSDDNYSSFVEDDTRKHICPWSNIECTCPYIEDCSKCPINPGIASKYDAYAIGTTNVGGVFSVYTNIYTEMSETSTVSTRVPYGELITVITIPNNNEWVFARYGNNTGYISKTKIATAIKWNGSNVPATISNMAFTSYDTSPSYGHYSLQLHYTADAESLFLTLPDAQNYAYHDANDPTAATNVFTATLLEVPSEETDDGGYTAYWANVTYWESWNTDEEHSTVLMLPTPDGDSELPATGDVKTNRMNIT